MTTLDEHMKAAADSPVNDDPEEWDALLDDVKKLVEGAVDRGFTFGRICDALDIWMEICRSARVMSEAKRFGFLPIAGQAAEEGE
jgi:hypothetical protein